MAANTANRLPMTNMIPATGLFWPTICAALMKPLQPHGKHYIKSLASNLHFFKTIVTTMWVNAKYYAIFKILSLLDSAQNLLQSYQNQ